MGKCQLCNGCGWFWTSPDKSDDAPKTDCRNCKGTGKTVDQTPDGLRANDELRSFRSADTTKKLGLEIGGADLREKLIEISKRRLPMIDERGAVDEYSFELAFIEALLTQELAEAKKAAYAAGYKDGGATMETNFRQQIVAALPEKLNDVYKFGIKLSKDDDYSKGYRSGFNAAIDQAINNIEKGGE